MECDLNTVLHTNIMSPKYDANYYDILRKYEQEDDGDWDDIVSPDDYDEILERKRMASSNPYKWS